MAVTPKSSYRVHSNEVIFESASALEDTWQVCVPFLRPLICQPDPLGTSRACLSKGEWLRDVNHLTQPGFPVQIP